MYNAAVWLYVVLMLTRAWCLCAAGKHCASVCVLGRTVGGRTVAGVVGGVECSDGEERGVCHASVWLCDADADACVVFACSLATLHFLLCVRTGTWRSHSG
jgi:hypothetical protein